jgi:hypothetical protein
VCPVMGAPKVAKFSLPCVEVPLSDSLTDSVLFLRFALVAPLGGALLEDQVEMAHLA